MTATIPSDHWLLNTEAAAASPTSEQSSPSLLELHQRWVPLEDERTRLEVQQGDLNVVDDRGQGFVSCGDLALYTDAEIDTLAAHGRLDDRAISTLKDRLAEHRDIAASVEALGGPEELDRRLAEIYEQADLVLDEIAAAPVHSLTDVAVLLDIALEKRPDSTMVTQQPWWDFHLARSIARGAPGFVYSYFRRSLRNPELDAQGIPVERDKSEEERLDDNEPESTIQLLVRAVEESPIPAFKVDELWGDGAIVGLFDRWLKVERAWLRELEREDDDGEADETELSQALERRAGELLGELANQPTDGLLGYAIKALVLADSNQQPGEADPLTANFMKDIRRIPGLRALISPDGIPMLRRNEQDRT